MTYIDILIHTVSCFTRLYRLHHIYTNLQYSIFPSRDGALLVPFTRYTERMSSVCSYWWIPFMFPLGFGWCFEHFLFWLRDEFTRLVNFAAGGLDGRVWNWFCRLLFGPWISTRSYESYCCDRNVKSVSTVNIHILRMILIFQQRVFACMKPSCGTEYFL